MTAICAAAQYSMSHYLTAPRGVAESKFIIYGA